MGWWLPEGRDKIGKANQIYGDGGNWSFGGEHTIVYTDIKL